MARDLEAVIFDFGGVILDIDFAATDLALRTLMGEAAALSYTKMNQSAIFDALEIGAISSEDFYQAIRKAAGKQLSKVEIDKAWNAMLKDVPLARLQFIRDVAKKYRVFLLSNTNGIHKEAFDQTLSKHLGTGGFDKLFERAYYSHVFGMRKPHVATYAALLKDINVEPCKALFIDDNIANIEGAAAAGMQVLHLKGELLEEPALNFLLS